ncbi:MAG: DoxX family membrane protein [Candidatus Paceibacterota bacterium]|jgi:uncharacterized membrane protein YphA (DoxX/SURF4 family)
MELANMLFLVGRIFFGAYWLMNASNHLIFQRTHLKGFVASKNIPSPHIAIVIAGLLLLAGGLGILLGVYAQLAIGALILFLVPVTILMHSFWLDKDAATRAGNMINFSKNMALVAALLMLLAIPTPWPFALF